MTSHASICISTRQLLKSFDSFEEAEAKDRAYWLSKTPTRAARCLRTSCGKSLMDTIPLLPDFLALLRFLSEEKVEYLVVGGMAVNYYGYHRSTGDLDMWVAVTPENQDRLAAALDEVRIFRASRCSATAAAKAEIHSHRPTAGSSRNSQRISGVQFEDVIATQKRCRLKESKSVLSASVTYEINKAAAGRIKDLADLECVSGRRAALNAATRYSASGPPILRRYSAICDLAGPTGPAIGPG